MDDAISAGVADLVNVIDNGHAAQGTILKDCSSEFKRAFDEADLIISKGQANFETLSDVKDKTIFIYYGQNAVRLQLLSGVNEWIMC